MIVHFIKAGSKMTLQLEKFIFLVLLEAIRTFELIHYLFKEAALLFSFQDFMELIHTTFFTLGNMGLKFLMFI